MSYYNLNRTTTSTTTRTTSTAKVSSDKRKAICMGLNDYPGSNNDLKGCVNDARNWSSLLNEIYGFNVKSLFDAELRFGAVTELIGNYISDSRAGDLIVITYSGHGTNVPDQNGDESDGRDEALCLYDGYLVDDCIRDMMKGLHPEASLTFISDSCHSGTVTRAFLAAMNKDSYAKPRFLPPQDEQEVLNSKASDIGNKLFHPEEGMREILISGCLPTEYSYDAYIGNKYQGAMSYFATQILRSQPVITYSSFYEKLKKVLPTSKYPQTPQLEGANVNKDRIMFS